MSNSVDIYQQLSSVPRAASYWISIMTIREIQLHVRSQESLFQPWPLLLATLNRIPLELYSEIQGWVVLSPHICNRVCPETMLEFPSSISPSCIWRWEFLWSLGGTTIFYVQHDSLVKQPICPLLYFVNVLRLACPNPLYPYLCMRSIC